ILVFEDKPKQECQQVSIEKHFEYSQKGQWLCAAVLRATDGLVSVAV
ncbi:hypothetical protein Tco_0529314, partial [Tanacetum coccineum]